MCMKTTGTQTSVPTSMINISCITCSVIVVKYIKFKLKLNVHDLKFKLIIKNN